MKSIHLYVAQEGYAARVSDTRSYESIRLVLFASKLSPSVLTTSLVRISCQGGPFRSFRMTIIRVATTTSTAEEIATLPKTVLLSWPGMLASHNTDKNDFHIYLSEPAKLALVLWLDLQPRLPNKFKSYRLWLARTALLVQVLSLTIHISSTTPLLDPTVKSKDRSSDMVVTSRRTPKFQMAPSLVMVLSLGQTSCCHLLNAYLPKETQQTTILMK